MAIARRRDFLKAIGAGVASLYWPSTLAQPVRVRHPMTDVVVLLPGITGSVLQKDSRDVWALSPQGVVGALRTLGANVQALKLAADPEDVDDLHDGVRAVSLFPDVHLIPGFWKIDGYGAVRKWIVDTFDVRPGQNFFEFPYDWRRDNRVAARRLARESHDWLRDFREKSGNASARLVLIAHSMGGLVSRYFIEVLGGWRDTRALITFGTPYRGSLKAVDMLCNGLRKSLGPLALADLSDLLRSFTSVYQLLPIYPCYDPGDSKLVRVSEADGIPSLDRARAIRADAFHREIERAVASNVKLDAYTRDRYRIHAIRGTFQPTLQSAKLVSGKVVLSTEYPGPDSKYAYDGDGTVPRVSATPIETRDDAMPMDISELHGSLQNAPGSLVQLEALLAPHAPVGHFRDLDLPRVSLEIEDMYSADEPVTMRVRCEATDVDLDATVVDTSTGSVVVRKMLRANDELVRTGTFEGLSAGTYRLTIGAANRSQRVNDVFVVVARTT